MSLESFLNRSIDACVNRASEGLRVLMDYTRFGLDDPVSSSHLKKIRHSLIGIVAGECFDIASLTDGRDSRNDVSRPTDGSSLPPPYRDPIDLFSANCRRVEEALRSIEETLRLTDVSRARAIEMLRYRIYDLQKEILPAVLIASHRSRMDFELYVVTDSQLSRGRSLEEVVRMAIRGGAGCIQLREKKIDIRSFLASARLLREITRGEGVTFVINDSLEVALEVGADGVHLGQDDLPLEVARRLSRGSLLIGISTHTEREALEAQAGGAGYINLGPIFPTQTKENPMEPVTPNFIRDMAPQLQIPFTTMGGIHADNVEKVVLAGADRVAVVSEVVSAENIESAARNMVELIRRAKEKRESS